MMPIPGYPAKRTNSQQCVFVSACLLAVLASLRPPRHSLRVQDLTLNPTSLNHKQGRDLASET